MRKYSKKRDMISLIKISLKTILFHSIVNVLMIMIVVSTAAAATKQRFVFPVGIVGAKSFYPFKLRTTGIAFVSSTVPSSTRIVSERKNLQERSLKNNNNQLITSCFRRDLSCSSLYHCHQSTARTTTSRPATTTTTSLQMSFSNSNTDRPMYMNIGTEEMEEIIEDYEEGGRIDSEYIIIDVRTDDEVIYTGKLSPNTYTLPVQTIMEYNVFDLPDTDFEDICGFSKPTYDETIVFTCKAGIRSVYACQFAAKSGYTKLINYTGGSSEWFATRGN